MIKKFLKKAMVLTMTAAMVLSLAACGGKSNEKEEAQSETAGDEASDNGDAADVSGIKVGVILIGDENEGYSLWNHRFIRCNGLRSF